MNKTISEAKREAHKLLQGERMWDHWQTDGKLVIEKRRHPHDKRYKIYTVWYGDFLLRDFSLNQMHEAFNFAEGFSMALNVQGCGTRTSYCKFKDNQ